MILGDLPRSRPAGAANREQLLTLQQAFGYTMEDLKVLIAPMAVSGKWAIGSMGEDAALACLSDRSQLLYRYFKQRFAQVSNPAMDSINERPVMRCFDARRQATARETAEPRGIGSNIGDHRLGARATPRTSRCPDPLEQAVFC